MRTAVCCLEVVAPPMSSGMVNSRRVISLATTHHLVERRRDEPGEADDVGFSSIAVSRILSHGHHHAEVDDLVVVAAEHDADDVLADVVHVALDRRQHELAAHAAGRRDASFSASMNGSR